MRALLAMVIFPLAAQTNAAEIEAQTARLRELAWSSPALRMVRTEFAIQTPSAGWGLEMVSSVAVDSKGVIYLLQRGDKADPVIAVDANGKVLRSWGKGLYKIPHAIRVDPQGNIWTTDAATSMVLKFTPDGKKLLEIPVGEVPARGSSDFRGTTDIAFAPNGRIFIADGYGNARILEYTAEGKRVRQFGERGTGPGQFNLPHGIAIDDDGTIYVADRENGRIQRFDLNGKYQGEWGNLGKTFSLKLSQGSLWIGTQARNEPNGSPGWLMKIDKKTGKVLGTVGSTGHHSVEVNAAGELLTGTRPDKVLWFRTRETTGRSGWTSRPVLRGRFGAVSSMKAEASLAAERILRAGGNAFDAAVAAQAVLGVTDIPSNGIGGDAVLLVWDAKSRQPYSINAEGTAPKLASIDWYNKNLGGKLPDSDTLLAGTVPGVVDAWYTLLDRWGTMTFAQVLEPAIELAENGYPLNEKIVGALNNSRKLRKYPTSVKHYQLEKLWNPGDIYTMPDLARTMKKLVEAERAAGGGRHGGLKAARDRFYKGDIARQMGEFSQANGGLFRYGDFAAYEAKVEKPVSVNYRGYEVLKNPSANQGPAELFALNLLEGYDLKKLGHNSAPYIHAGVEAVKLAFADREFLGDELFIKVPWARLLAKDRAAERRKLIDPERASMELRMAKIEGFDRFADYTIAAEERSDGDTSYVCVVDKDRNSVTFTPSLHSGFGTGVVMGDLGFSFNCRGDYYSLKPGHANALEGGKRPRSTLQGTLVLKDGKPFLVTGSPGGDDQCMRTMQTFLNLVEFGMNIQQAIEAPRWSTRSFPMSYFPHKMYVGEVSLEGRIPEAVREELKKKGHKIRVNGPWSLGMNAAIVIDPVTGVLNAGADPRVDAYALAW